MAGAGEKLGACVQQLGGLLAPLTVATGVRAEDDETPPDELEPVVVVVLLDGLGDRRDVPAAGNRELAGRSVPVRSQDGGPRLASSSRGCGGAGVKNDERGSSTAKATAQASAAPLTPAVATRQPPCPASPPAMTRPLRPPTALPAMYSPIARPSEEASTSSAR